MNNFNVEEFISRNITFRDESMFIQDIWDNNDKLKQAINQKSALIIGGAGTIGSSFIKAMLRFEPKKIVVVDTNENGLTELTRDLRSTVGLNVPDQYTTYPMDFGDEIFFKMFQKQGPFDIVANFAAHKHVRSEKDRYSVSALLNNNILKANKLLDLLERFQPKHFFCVSTDKAANPVNIMGASKKIMEELINSYSGSYKITTARFANVAFSNGSLLDGFINRMLKSQPLSAPEDVKRYFVSPEESGQICLLACILGNSGDIFYPKLRPSQMLTFSEIADIFVKSMGYNPLLCSSEEDAKIRSLEMKNNKSSYPVYYFKSDTSGEKSYEEFYTEDEELDLESFFNLGVIKNSPKKSFTDIKVMLNELNDLMVDDDLSKSNIISFLKNHLPDFSHNETGRNLDEKM